MSGKSFSYDGHLIFNRIARFPSELNSVLERLASHDEDEESNYSMRTSFEELELSKYDGFPELDPSFRILSEELNLLRFTKESAGSISTVLTEDGSRVKARPIHQSVVDVIWKTPERVFFFGGRSETDNAFKEIIKQSNIDRPKQISFNPFFFLWVFYKYFEDDKIGDIDILSLKEAKFDGDGSEFGRQLSVNGSDLEKDMSVIAGLLTGKKLNQLGGVFSIEGHYVDLTLHSNGRIHIKAAEDIQRSNSLVRYLTAINTIESITKLYESWTHRPDERRYPPPDFYLNLREYAKSEGVDIQYNIRPPMEELAQKRGNELDSFLEDD
ncbi:hypothetical protein [Haladaptatus sp. R4]|uniref:hypothetical protein n=1 Tax=Haladaptatus sp. R4 TaxID=1679489 RepID=UPI000B0D0E51|nr:hypothetical protein [Haladaptatus sp. R4]